MQECKPVTIQLNANQKLCKDMIQSPDDTLEEFTKGMKRLWDLSYI